ncbi:hypothetical protein [Butyricimonas sp. Marseille-P3923]|uniref:hypothetical protein n=1 Tax=Butyricimonas sp. Marseille-P3923 TaxID=1987504 RepID=UPI000C06C15C|nr:hypothetical protein [Butyricimonas sp. Marseille-P3923]
MKEYIPFFASVVLLAIYLGFKLTELEWFWGCILLASIIIYTLISNTKLTKEKLESRICDYLYDNGFEHEKEEGELYFTRKNLKYHLEIIPRDNVFVVYFSIPIEDDEYNTRFDSFDKLFLGQVVNAKYRFVKVRTYNDSYFIDVSMDIENSKVFKKRFFNVMSLYDDVISDIHVQKEEIMKRNMQQQERPKIGF